MLLFFDTEFTGLHKNTTLISIGIKSQRGDVFYAECFDFDVKQINEWLRENVISNLLFHGKSEEEMEANANMLREKYGEDKTSVVYGNKREVAKQLLNWLVAIHAENCRGNEKLVFWSDCLSYDWVLFNDLFGTAMDIPDVVYYIPFDICTHLNLVGVDPDINREEFAYGKGADRSAKHNALFDADVIWACYEKLRRYPLY